ncbi:MAG TPA: hypothetical protein VIG47_14010 [Gemmatimonadaceae bacterium]|jgi:hypothetical protein
MARYTRGLYGYATFGTGSTRNTRASTRLNLVAGKPTTEAREYLKSLKPGVRPLVLNEAKRIAESKNRAYVTRQMCLDAHAWVFAEPLT